MSKLFFIDTQAFVKEGFRFDHGVLGRLPEYCNIYDLNLVLPSIIQREIEKNLRDRIAKLVDSFKTASVKLEAIANCQKSLLEQTRKLNTNEFETSLLEMFRDYLKSCNVIELVFDEKNIHQIVDDYFAISPPFGGGKKRKEFPDAIAASSITSLAESKDQTIAIITADQDWIRLCEESNRLDHYEQISSFLATMLTPDEKQNELMKIISSIPSDFRRLITERWKEINFWPQSNLTEVEEVEDINVVDLAVAKLDVIRIDSSSAAAELDLEIEYFAEVSCIDHSRSRYDKEEGRFWGAESETREVEGFFDERVFIEVEFEDSDYSKLRFSKVEFSTESIDVWIDDVYH